MHMTMYAHHRQCFTYIWSHGYIGCYFETQYLNLRSRLKGSFGDTCLTNTCTPPLISLRQLNVENEERLFSSLKDITLRISSRRPGEITYNASIRLQEESKHSQHKLSTMETTISKHAATMAPTNSIITKEMKSTKVHNARH